MRPLIKALFILSVFGVLAVHVSNGFLREMAGDVVPGMINLLDRALSVLLVTPLGRSATIYGLWALGAALAVVTFLMTPVLPKGKPPERRSAW